MFVNNNIVINQSDLKNKFITFVKFTITISVKHRGREEQDWEPLL